MADLTTNLRKKHPKRNLINQMYTSGVLKTETLGLQCVGFDHELYNALVKRFNMNKPSLKREESHRFDTDRKAKSEIKVYGYILVAIPGLLYVFPVPAI